MNPRQQHLFKLVASDREREDYFALRQAIFTVEQGIFPNNDQDAWDAEAYPIIAVDREQVVGVVRIYEESPGLWYGGRLGVHAQYRRGGRIGQGLIYKAVTTAHGWGCQRFLATVQEQNVRFFARLHWHTLQEVILHGHLHHLMEADLAHYPPGCEERPPQRGGVLLC
ncbi:MSMEG_0567/Sll0786 family nitrogen starvation N-acetyltransferase [Anthocerotibacter panamensis]|uniref:MSMEG_0567/Sll0786 family nitrogen starvation N-acetyltransferase n=1 Tax=Anthocerotibacter panamensis TaxID=2857077 RepID=UPI001C4039D8|nr:MSMEG_0567/Sll0786 family nitrogen starvation N-acetyltransferase [Anthocerotibacter panamensis]